MANIEDLIKDVSSVSAWICQQKQMDMDSEAIQTGQVNSISGKIAALRSLSATDATVLLRALQKGPWKHDELQILSVRIADKVAETDASAKAKASSRGGRGGMAEAHLSECRLCTS